MGQVYQGGGGGRLCPLVVLILSALTPHSGLRGALLLRAIYLFGDCLGWGAVD